MAKMAAKEKEEQLKQQQQNPKLPHVTSPLPLAVQEDNKPKIDDTTSLITNIVFARDPSILEADQKSVDQKTAFFHENYLNVKDLVK